MTRTRKRESPDAFSIRVEKEEAERNTQQCARCGHMRTSHTTTYDGLRCPCFCEACSDFIEPEGNER